MFLEKCLDDLPCTVLSDNLRRSSPPLSLLRNATSACVWRSTAAELCFRATAARSVVSGSAKIVLNIVIEGVNLCQGFRLLMLKKVQEICGVEYGEALGRRVEAMVDGG